MADANTAPKSKRYTVTAAVSEDTYAALDDYRWSNRMTMSEVVSAAIKAFLPTDEPATDDAAKGAEDAPKSAAKK